MSITAMECKSNLDNQDRVNIAKSLFGILPADMTLEEAKERRYTMKKVVYPAVFHEAEEGGFWISFPDFPECMTQGNNLQEAYEMAADALNLAITSRMKEKTELPAASDSSTILVEESDFCVLVEYDLFA